MLIFLFTDIEGSTRLWEKYTQEMGGVIARHDAILQEQIGAFGGRITKHTGDGVTAAFEAGAAHRALPLWPGGCSATLPEVGNLREDQ